MQEKSRILVFTTAFRPMIGGSEIALEEVIRRLPDTFFDIVTPRYERDFKMLEAGNNFNVYRTGMGAGVLDKALFPISGFLKAVRLIRDNNYRAVHAYQASYGGGVVWLLKTLNFKLPFILTMQEGKELNKQMFLLNWLRGLIIKKADAVTVISNYLGEYVKKVAKDKKTVLIPNGVDLEKFKISSDKLQKNFGFHNSGVKKIITVSRLVPKNGIADLIRAFKILNTKYARLNTKLLIIGDGYQREELFQLVGDLDLKNSVEFLGSILNDKIYEYLASSSVFIRPSLSEGLGSAFLEAMAAGVPIIGTPVGGIPDFLKDPSTHSGQATGLFCRVGDPEDIADKIAAILSDDDLRNKLITNGRKLVEEKYSWNKIASEFAELYNNI